MPYMLDLYAGFGGQSEAYLKAGWDILRIDNNPMLSEVPNMVVMDAIDLEPNGNVLLDFDYIHASPPCLEFSTAFSAPRGKAHRAGDIDYQPSLELLHEALRIIKVVEPKFWSIENVKGSIKYFAPILGPPRLIVGAWVYWGNFPLFDPSTLKLPTKAMQDKRWSPLRANYRAHIPLCVSQAFLGAMQSQRSILEF
tara:strand:+ start:366 stop:953 length:588 start_codon:yes stop_codon:yes gene_type:complete